eukprot:gene16925-biopygen4801
MTLVGAISVACQRAPKHAFKDSSANLAYCYCFPHSNHIEDRQEGTPSSLREDGVPQLSVQWELSWCSLAASEMAPYLEPYPHKQDVRKNPGELLPSEHCHIPQRRSETDYPPIDIYTSQSKPLIKFSIENVSVISQGT